MINYLGVDEEKVTRIYLGVNEEFRRPVAVATLDIVRHRYHLPRRFMLYVGQIYPPKNFGNLLRAYASVGPRLGINLVIAGTHTWLCERELKLIDELGLKPWIIQPGWIDHESLPAFYALALALLLPSLYEACPSPLLEAMAVGCPIVTSNRNGCREIAGDAALLVEPEDVGSIAHGIERMATEEDTRERFVLAGRERIKEFDWDKCARQTMTILERTQARPGGTRAGEHDQRDKPSMSNIAQV
jgi:glycosyltransferase involved in cell wall biosynthesis